MSQQNEFVLKSCFWNCSLKNGSLLVAFLSMAFSMIIAVFGFTVIMAVLSSKDFRVEPVLETEQEVDVGIEEEINGTIIQEAWYLVKHKQVDPEYENSVLRYLLYNDIVITALELMLYSLFQMIVTVLLVVGIKQGKPGYMMPWLTVNFQDVLMMFGFIISTSLRSKLSPFQHHINKQLVAAVLLGLILFSIYMGLIVWSYIRYLWDSEKIRRYSNEEPMQGKELSVLPTYTKLATEDPAEKEKQYYLTVLPLPDLCMKKV